jgi:AcrR family transcriptional regulator
LRWALHVVVKERALRADAERNRRRVLEVAQAVFAAEGLAVPIDEIARRAGLGVGTLYRHFPTKEALFAAIVITRMEEIVADARAQLEAKSPGQAFFAFLRRVFDGWGQKKDFHDALASAGADLKDIARVKEEMYRAMNKLLERAQGAGAVRADISVKEILALIGGAYASIERQGISEKGRDRMLAVVFDGLRAPPGPASTVKKRAR